MPRQTATSVHHLCGAGPVERRAAGSAGWPGPPVCRAREGAAGAAERSRDRRMSSTEMPSGDAACRPPERRRAAAFACAGSLRPERLRAAPGALCARGLAPRGRGGFDSFKAAPIGGPRSGAQMRPDHSDPYPPPDRRYPLHGARHSTVRRARRAWSERRRVADERGSSDRGSMVGWVRPQKERSPRPRPSPRSVCVSARAPLTANVPGILSTLSSTISPNVPGTL